MALSEISDIVTNTGKFEKSYGIRTNQIPAVGYLFFTSTSFMKVSNQR